MIDLVYPIKEKGSRLDDVELRYSLRSVERHLRMEIGKLVIVGFKPPWLGDAVVIPATDRGDKAMNLHAKYVQMCESAEISDPFLLLDDDHVFLQDHATVPPVTKGSLLKLYRQYLGTGHGRYLRNCLDLLNELGLPSRNYQIHYPILIEKPVLRRVVAAMGRKPMVMGSVYGNMVNGLAEELKQDYRVNTEQDFLNVKDGRFMSLSPISTKQVLDFLAARFPSPSAWESDAKAVAM